MRSTGFPPLKRIRNGIPETWYSPARFGLSSVFNFTNFALPACEEATFSTTGPSILHGPHHGAQKSTSTGWLEPSTSLWKLVCETSANALICVVDLLLLGLL